jgi:Tfp pilus assembly protein PilO
MSKKPLNISEEAAVQMPMKTVASLIAMIAVGTWAYFGIHEKLSGEAELFMLVEHLAGVLEEVDKEVKSMRNNAVNIEFLKDRTKKLTEDVEKLIRNGSGSH